MIKNYTSISFRHVLIFSLVLSSLFCSAQTVSDSIYTQRLYYLCKVWGHAKYYHTEVAKGNVNWDNVLLSTFNEVKAATTDVEYNDALETMLKKAGVMGTSIISKPTLIDSLSNNSDQNWIHHPILSDSVQALLDTIDARFRPQTHALVQKAFTHGNSTFENDDLFYTNAFDAGADSIRALAVFRYWNIIHYFFPYKKIMDQHWDSTLVQFIPKIINATDELSYHLAFRKYTASIDDSHAFFYSPIFITWRGFFLTPFEVRFIENETVVTKVLPHLVQLKKGDIIKEIDGYNIYDLRDSLREYVNGSNDEVIEREISRMVMRGVGGGFSLKVDDGTQIMDKPQFRAALNATNLANTDVNPPWRDTIINTGCHIGIVDMGELEKEDIPTMMSDLWNMDAIIFDIRNYPNSTLWTLVDYLYPSPISIANFATPNITYPGEFYWNGVTIGTGTSSPYAGEIIILFDERTQSQAEYTCMGLEQFPNALKIGSTTSAADGNPSKIYLPGSIITNATFLGTFYPDYTPTQRVGIIPDVVIKPTILGIRNGKDEVLEYALNCNLIGLKNLPVDEKISLYPNPVNGQLYYTYLDNKKDLLSFEILDVSGRSLQLIKPKENQKSVDFTSYPSGIYYLKINTIGGGFTKKILKK